jgi:hypothetical protein
MPLQHYKRSFYLPSGKAMSWLYSLHVQIGFEESSLCTLLGPLSNYNITKTCLSSKAFSPFIQTLSG